MEKEFIPYEQALALKELGFDEPCFWWYDFEKELRKDRIGVNSINSKYFLNGNSCSAPLYQQCFRWFREKYNLKGHVEAVEYLDGTPNTYHWCIFNKYNSGYDQLTYEEAELACLKKLIELVKEK
jgi:hypothetical protein